MPFASAQFSRAAFRIGLLALLLGGAAVRSPAQRDFLEAAPPGLIEAGTPQFEVRSSDMLGFSSPPTDLHLLPDGRILVFGGDQIALGDGVRWEVYQHAASDRAVPATRLAFAASGAPYTATEAGFSAIHFGNNAEWFVRPLAPLPDTGQIVRSVPRACVQVGDEWIWHSGCGALIAWRPGQTPRVIGSAATLAAVFTHRGALFMADRTRGTLLRLAPQRGATPEVVDTPVLADTILCTAPLGEDLLVGTYGHGVKVFDGRVTRPLVTSGVLAEAVRVTDLCAVVGGFYAAAVEGRGVYFFDSRGNIVQALGRSADHRLSCVQRLIPSPDGVIWGLLADGIVQIVFPSRFSYFEPLLGQGVISLHPLRYQGNLWFYGDGVVRRVIYDRTGRLCDVVADTPPDAHAFVAGLVGPWLVAGTDRGGFYRAPSGWTPFVAATDLSVLDHPPLNGRWLYAATGEVGWLLPSPEGIAVERFACPQLERVFGSVGDADGSVWLELGEGQVGHLLLQGDTPTVHVYGASAGLPANWTQLFRIGDRVLVNVGDRIMRFDAASGQFVQDHAFARDFPSPAVLLGRPAQDAGGRIWLTTSEGTRLLERQSGAWHESQERLPSGVLPIYYTCERSGVVWLQGEQRLVRYDPSMPAAEPLPLRATITRLHLPGTHRTVFSPGTGIPPLSHAENSMVVQFAAPGRSTRAVVFEVFLEGAQSEWMSSGSSGSAVFNHLHEGRYILHVRPRSGPTVGREAVLRFEVLPPWYRTSYAYAGYWLGGLAFVVLSGRLFSFLQRRENTRLERLVAQRTGELHRSNQRLEAQVEKIRMLSQAIEQSPVAVLITHPGGTIIFANPRACEMSGRSLAELAGRDLRILRAPENTSETYAEIAAVLRRGESWHGQLVNRRADGRIIQVRSTIAPVRAASGDVRQLLVLEEDITQSLAENEQRRRLEAQLFQAQKLESLGTLAGGIAHDFNNILTAMLGFCELAELNAGDNAAVRHDLNGIRTAGVRAKDVVSRILTFSRKSQPQAMALDLRGPVEECVKLLRASAPATIEICPQLADGTVSADPTQIQQLVLNLCTNAIHAIGDRCGRIDIQVAPCEVDAATAALVPRLWIGPAVRLRVRDTGAGIDPALLDRIFDPFFTTKPTGIGTGLGLAIVQTIVAAHDGAIRVQTERGVGTTFDVFFRRSKDRPALEPALAPVPPGRNQEILVVDDERPVATFIAARLAHHGYRTMLFDDPAAALASFETEPKRFDALVTDLTMPKLTGLDLLERIRALGRTVPAVVVTGYDADHVRERIGRLPHCVLVSKPFSGDDLARALDRALQGSRALR